MIEGMVIDMNDKQLATLTQLRLFLEGTATVDLQVTAAERYAFIGRTLQRFGYRRLPRADKGVLLRFLERVSGYSRQQLTRLVKRGSGQTPLSKRYSASRTSFARTYTSADVQQSPHCLKVFSAAAATRCSPRAPSRRRRGPGTRAPIRTVQAA